VGGGGGISRIAACRSTTSPPVPIDVITTTATDGYLSCRERLSPGLGDRGRNPRGFGRARLRAAV